MSTLDDIDDALLGGIDDEELDYDLEQEEEDALLADADTDNYEEHEHYTILNEERAAKDEENDYLDIDSKVVIDDNEEDSGNNKAKIEIDFDDEEPEAEQKERSRFASERQRNDIVQVHRNHTKVSQIPDNLDVVTVQSIPNTNVQKTARFQQRGNNNNYNNNKNRFKGGRPINNSNNYRGVEDKLGKTVLINPHFRGNVQVNQNSRLVWDSPPVNQSQGNFTPQQLHQRYPNNTQTAQVAPFNQQHPHTSSPWLQNQPYNEPQPLTNFNSQSNHFNQPPLVYNQISQSQWSTGERNIPCDNPTYQQNNFHQPHREQRFPNNQPLPLIQGPPPYQSVVNNNPQFLNRNQVPYNNDTAARRPFNNNPNYNYNQNNPQFQGQSFNHQLPQLMQQQPYLPTPQPTGFNQPFNNNNQYNPPQQPFQSTSSYDQNFNTRKQQQQEYQPQPFNNNHRQFDQSKRMPGKNPNRQQGGGFHQRSPPKRRTFENTPVAERVVSKKKKRSLELSNLHEVPTVDTITGTQIEDKPDSEDEETKAYRLQIEEQKKLREKIIQEKEERRKLAQAQKNAEENSLINVIKTNPAVVKLPEKLITANQVKQQGQLPPQQRNQQQQRLGNVQQQQQQQKRNNQQFRNKNQLRTIQTIRTQNQQQQQQQQRRVGYQTVANVFVDQNNQLPQAQTSRIVMFKNQPQPNSRRVVLKPPQTPVQSEPDTDVDDSVSKSFLSERKVIPNNNIVPGLVSDPLIDSSIVLVSNLAAATNDIKLKQLCQGLGPIQNIEMIPNSRQATIRFKNNLSAQKFFKKYQRKIVDLSMIQVTLQPLN